MLKKCIRKKTQKRGAWQNPSIEPETIPKQQSSFPQQKKEEEKQDLSWNQV